MLETYPVYSISARQQLRSKYESIVLTQLVKVKSGFDVASLAHSLIKQQRFTGRMSENAEILRRPDYPTNVMKHFLSTAAAIKDNNLSFYVWRTYKRMFDMEFMSVRLAVSYPKLINRFRWNCVWRVYTNSCSYFTHLNSFCMTPHRHI
jgi:hypothetical protein